MRKRGRQISQCASSVENAASKLELFSCNFLRCVPRVGMPSCVMVTCGQQDRAQRSSSGCSARHPGAQSHGPAAVSLGKPTPPGEGTARNASPQPSSVLAPGSQGATKSGMTGSLGLPPASYDCSPALSQNPGDFTFHWAKPFAICPQTSELACNPHSCPEFARLTSSTGPAPGQASLGGQQPS